ncbi:MAG: hypothetical protein ACUVRV_08750 [Cyanobacteriota bacterium]
MTGSDRSLFSSSGGSSRRPSGSRRKASAKSESEPTTESTPVNEEPTMSSAEVEALKSQLAESQQQLQDYQAKLFSLEAQLQQVSAHRDELQKALAQLQIVADERAKTIQELQSRMGQAPAQPKLQPQTSPLVHTPKKIMNRPIFDNVSPTDEKMPPYLLD